MNIRLSDHFTLEEFTKSAYATENNVINRLDPDIFGHEYIMNNLKRTCEVLEEIRAFLGRPLKVLSGYRSSELNYKIGGSKNSAHVYGCACDIEMKSNEEQELIMNNITELCEFDQVISYPNRFFMHFGVNRHGKNSRNELLVFVNNGYQLFTK